MPAAYLIAAAIIAGLVRHPGSRSPGPHAAIDLANGTRPRWFLTLVVLGLAAALVSAAGPGLALRRLRPSGPAVTRPPGRRASPRRP